MKEGDRVCWQTRKRFKTFGYKTHGFVAYTEGDRVRIRIPWKGTQRGETMVWKDQADVEVVGNEL